MEAVFNGGFENPLDEFNGQGKRPVVFDVLGADRETSVLPKDLQMVMYVNPNSMKLSYQKNIVRIQTRGGYVEQHWGDSVEQISFEFATGGFMRLTSGLSNKTGTGLLDSEQSRKGRRETIQYDRYLDLLALFKNNGAVYDANGSIASQGYLKITFDGGIYIGWFDNFSVTEDVSKPFQFALTAQFSIDEEIQVWRSTIVRAVDEGLGLGPFPEFAREPIFDAFDATGGIAQVNSIAGGIAEGSEGLQT